MNVFDVHMRHKTKAKLLELEEDPSEKGNLIRGYSPGLRKMNIFHAGVQYRAVYDIKKDKKEILVIFIGSCKNFYKELRRFLL